MNETITLGIDGDTGLIKTKLAAAYELAFPVYITESEEKNGTTYLNFVCCDNESVLEKYLNIIAEYIIERYETRLIGRILDEEYPYLTQAQRRKIMQSKEVYCDDNEVGYLVRKKAVLISLYEYLKEDKKMMLSGFVSFRLRDYELILELLVLRLVDDYMTKKEYDEFISLLKSFVAIQYPRPDVLNIIVPENKRYLIYDKDGKDITDKCIAEFSESVFPLSENELDDVLISILITVAPKTVVVHGREHIKNEELFHTISNVFDNVKYCGGCDLCLH